MSLGVAIAKLLRELQEFCVDTLELDEESADVLREEKLRGGS